MRARSRAKTASPKISPRAFGNCKAFSIKLEIQLVIVFSAALPRKIQTAQRIIAFPHLIPLFSLDDTSISGKGEVKKKNDAIKGFQKHQTEQKAKINSIIDFARNAFKTE